MALARYFVVPRGNDWLVTLEGRRMAVHPTQPLAIDNAIVMADLMATMRHDADVMVEDVAGGGLRLVWASGEDQPPVAPTRPLQVLPSPSHVKRVQQAPGRQVS